MVTILIDTDTKNYLLRDFHIEKHLYKSSLFNCYLKNIFSLTNRHLQLELCILHSLTHSIEILNMYWQETQFFIIVEIMICFP